MHKKQDRTAARVLWFIKRYIDENGFSPSLRDIANGCEIGLTTARFHVLHLVDLKVLKIDYGTARSIRFNDKAANS